ncbi:hypothetical protein Cgig2_018712 [Carnegiea gigantea]|uniref:Transcription repressor n=1 Tax=Carnegiea gigantea TaxID=171969 RepID=A0A9Q1KGC1_9CARY|nr:hypothetical protein Cgig2_018712 [Carnegiea gigantea]
MEKKNSNSDSNKFKLKLAKIFSSSCITQDISKVIDHQKPVFIPKTPLIEDDDEEEEYQNTFSYSIIRQPKQHTPLLTCKPRCPESFDRMVRESCLIPTAGNPFPRRKLAGRYSLLSPTGDFSGHQCPPVSPASPFFQRDTKKKKKKKMTRRQRSKNGSFSNKLDRTHFKSHNPFNFSSSNETDWFSSDDEKEEDDEERAERTLFSSSKSFSFSSKSISLPSDSEPHNRNRVRHRRRRSEPKGFPSKGMKIEVMPLEGKVKDTFAVVKSSSDPCNDFRTSMVEMIIEKQIFGERELEQLLHCFLYLNSPHHHKGGGVLSPNYC